MAGKNLYLCFLTVLLFLIVHSSSGRSILPEQKAPGPPVPNPGKTWCVAQINAPPAKLQSFLDTTCAKLNCSEIKPGGGCFEPDTLYNHASYILNVNYRATKVCPPDIGAIAIYIDPSKGNCHYS